MEYAISFLTCFSEIHSPTDNTSLCTTASLPQSHHAAIHRFSSRVYTLGVSGDIQLAFILENCFLFTCCKYVQTPLQNQFTSCFISCLSVCRCFMEELTREKGKPVNAAGYCGSDSNYPRDVADHTGHVLWITQLLTRANTACYRLLPGVWLFSEWSCIWSSHPLLTESEVRWLLTIIALTGGDVDVQQKPPIQVALLKEETSIPCKVIFPYMPKYTKFSICYYWINSLDQRTSIYSRSENIAIPSGKENKTAALSYNYRIMPLENTSSTGMYYCEVKWNDIQKVGKGVFVLVRGKWTTRREGQELKNQLDLAMKIWSLLFFFSIHTCYEVKYE